MEILRSHIAYPFCSGAGPHPDYLIDLVSGLLLMGPGIGAGPPILAGEVFPRFTLRISVSQTQSRKQPDSFLAQSVLPSSLRLSPAPIRPRPPPNHFSGHSCTSPALRLWRTFWQAGCPPGLAPSAPHNDGQRLNRKDCLSSLSFFRLRGRLGYRSGSSSV